MKSNRRLPTLSQAVVLRYAAVFFGVARRVRDAFGAAVDLAATFGEFVAFRSLRVGFAALFRLWTASTTKLVGV
ncbi:hypothetical protein HQ496_09395 [bacterium]|nr:hypothetical protein [bacterium]